jgi:hypothetical protein
MPHYLPTNYTAEMRHRGKKIPPACRAGLFGFSLDQHAHNALLLAGYAGEERKGECRFACSEKPKYPPGKPAGFMLRFSVPADRKKQFQKSGNTALAN